MKLTAIKKYLKIYIAFLKFSIIFSTTYRFSFIIQLFVEFGYQAVVIFFFRIIYGNVQSIAGWSYYEILFFLGLNVITSEILLAICYIRNLDELPYQISRGNIDMALTKPINTLFNLSLSKPYFSAITSSISGVFLMIYSFSKLNLPLSIANFLQGVLLLSCGFIIAYSILVIFSSLSFVFINTTKIPEIAENIIVNYKENPHQVYQGIVRIIFFYIFPVVFLTSIPATAFLQGVGLNYIALALSLAAIFLFLAIKLWDNMIKHYSSASS
jgi:ABC-2 type transport system permease protein